MSRRSAVIRIARSLSLRCRCIVQIWPANATPADPPGDELAPRRHRCQADRVREGRIRRLVHQCGAPQSEILAGLDRLSGLGSRARSLELRTCPEITESASERVKYGFTTI